MPHQNRCPLTGQMPQQDQCHTCDGCDTIESVIRGTGQTIFPDDIAFIFGMAVESSEEAYLDPPQWLAQHGQDFAPPSLRALKTTSLY